MLAIFPGMWTEPQTFTCLDCGVVFKAACRKAIRCEACRGPHGAARSKRGEERRKLRHKAAKAEPVSLSTMATI